MIKHDKIIDQKSWSIYLKHWNCSTVTPPFGSQNGLVLQASTRCRHGARPGGRGGSGRRGVPGDQCHVHGGCGPHVSEGQEKGMCLEAKQWKKWWGCLQKVKKNYGIWYNFWEATCLQIQILKIEGYCIKCVFDPNASTAACLEWGTAPIGRARAPMWHPLNVLLPYADMFSPTCQDDSGFIKMIIYTKIHVHLTTVWWSAVDSFCPKKNGPGVHFLIPWFERPIIFDVRARPHTMRGGPFWFSLLVVEESFLVVWLVDCSAGSTKKKVYQKLITATVAESFKNEGHRSPEAKICRWPLGRV